MIIYHRGIIREKENQFESLVGIKDIKLNTNKLGIEFDIQLTKDNQLICYHDKDLNRLHNQNHNINDLNYNDLIKYNIPLLSDIIDELKGNDSFFMDIELKYYDNNKIKDYCAKVIKEIDKVKVINNIVLTSFHIDVVKELLVFRNVPVGIIIDSIDDFNIDLINSLINDGLKYIVINKSMIHDILKIDSIKHIQILVYTFFDNKSTYKDDLDLINSISGENTIHFIMDNYNEFNF